MTLASLYLRLTWNVPELCNHSSRLLAWGEVMCNLRVPDLFADAYKGTDREKVAADLAAFIRDWCTTSRPAICLRGTDTREEIITDRGPHGYREGPGLINLRRWSRYVLEAILCDPPLTRSGSIQRINFMGAGLAYLLQPHDGGAQLQRANAEAEIMRFAASFPR